MKLVPAEVNKFTVELTKEQVKYIKEFTQNSLVSPEEENKEEREIRLSLFVGASRILGVDMNDDGTINRSSSVIDNIIMNIKDAPKEWKENKWKKLVM